MNSRDRFLSALKGEKVDCPPLAHISALTTIELQDITGCYMPEVHTDAEKLVKLCAANYEVLGFDAVCFIINYFNEPAALGCKINWGNKSQLPMYLSHPWVEEKDAYVPQDLLRGKPEDIERQVFENLESGTDIISPECPNENLLAISKAIKKFHLQQKKNNGKIK